MSGVRECSAMVPLVLVPGTLDLLRCPEPPAVEVEGRCRCGHVRGGRLCEEHAELLGHCGCRACLEDENRPHDCLMTVRRVTEAGHG